MDKGYQGSQDDVREIIMKKKQVSRSLNSMEKKISERIGVDRVIVENYFGQMICL